MRWLTISEIPFHSPYSRSFRCCSERIGSRGHIPQVLSGRRTQEWARALGAFAPADSAAAGAAALANRAIEGGALPLDDAEDAGATRPTRLTGPVVDAELLAVPARLARKGPVHAERRAH